MSLLSDLLDYYDFAEEDYAAFQKLGSKQDIPNPFVKVAFFSSLVQYIQQAIREKKRFVIYGDYDVDGITSTAIMVATLQKLGAEVGYFIPSRYKEGYGLNSARIAEFAAKKYDILIAVDNGISKNSEVEFAKSRGLETIIIDHHQAQETLPEAKFIYQQFLSGYSDYNISAAFLALTLSYGLLGEYDDYLVTLAGIAVISDLMPLKSANVALVRMALENLQKHRYANLMALVSEKSAINISILGYEIIPILNSAGRIKAGLEVNNAVTLLLATNIDKIKILAEKFIGYNTERKEMVLNGFDDSTIDHSADIVLYRSELPSGVSGLLAGRILSTTNKPVVVYTQDPVTLNYVASLRSPKNYNIVGALANLKDYFLDFGGHLTAAGVTIKENKMADFLRELPKYLTPFSLTTDVRKMIPLDIAKFNLSDYRYIESFEPFGIEHEEPLFLIEVAAENFISSAKNPIHLFLNIDRNLKICFFSGLHKIPSSGPLKLSGHLRKNSFYRSGLYCDFIVDDIVNS